MLSLRTLAIVAAAIAGIHGYIYLKTEQVHPCKAAEARLMAEYGLTAFGVGLDMLGSAFAGKEYRPRNAEEGKLIRKIQSMETFGVFGCYAPAVLGWKAIPPL